MKCKHCLEDIPAGATRCSKCHGDLKGSNLSWMKKAALAGAGIFATAVITSSIVPGISAELDHDRTLREERLRVAHSIVEQGTRVEIDINNLQTMLTVFFKDSRAMSAGELKEAQEQMRPAFASRYLEFERVGWWWFRRVQRDARFPEPLEDWKSRQLDSLCNEYSATLGKSTAALNEIWTAVLREPPTKDHIARQGKLITRHNAALEPLGEKRRDLIWKMASLFERPQPRRWFEFWRRTTA
jgi:hypothetical protein